jgi:16S rRNA (guanine527-N7)-methyltransferase
MDEIDLLKSGARELGVGLMPAQQGAFRLYLSLLLKWNAKVNLTAITGPRDVVIKHFLDSLSLCRLLPAGQFRAADIGSGAGFPGLALKVALPDIVLTLIEPAHKKAAFLKEAARLMALKGVSVLESRAEAMGPGYENSFDILFSRAFKAPADLLPLAGALLRPGGSVALSLGPGTETRVPAGWEVLRREEITLPFSDYKRTLVLIAKK